MTGVSVVVTTYNDGEFLERALASVRGQTTRPAEVIVVDDGSATDEAADVVSRVSTSQFPVRYIRQVNRGPSAARNTGLHAASQEFVAFLDVDDVWLPSNLELKLALLRGRSADYLGAYGSFLRDDSVRPAVFGLFDGLPPAAAIGKPGGFPGGAPAYLFRREALLAVDGFDEDLFVNEDFDLLLRLNRLGYKVVGDTQPGFVRTMRMGSLTRHANPQLAYGRVSRFLEKAEAQEYFERTELRRRWRHARLSLVRAMIASRLGVASTASVVRATFSRPPPGSIVEWLILWISRMVRPPAAS